MIDNNLILLIAIGIVIFLIMNLNNKKYSKKSSNSLRTSKKINSSSSEKYNNHSDHNIENFVNYNVDNNVNHYVDNIDNIDNNIDNNVKHNIENFQNSNPKQLFDLEVDNAPAPGPSSVPAPSGINVYNSNLKGSPSSVTSSSTNINGADYGQGYNLGVNTKDPSLAKFMSQAPPQNTKLISDDLLPKVAENWFETPSVGTKIDDANLLADAIFKTGVDTVGSTRKNPSYDIRGNIANPKFPISPWNNSSYEPDTNLRGLCI